MCDTTQYFIYDRSAAYKNRELQFGSKELQNVILHGTRNSAALNSTHRFFSPPQLVGLAAARPVGGWSHVQCPGQHFAALHRKRFVTFFYDSLVLLENLAMIYACE